MTQVWIALNRILEEPLAIVERKHDERLATAHELGFQAVPVRKQLRRLCRRHVGQGGQQFSKLLLFAERAWPHQGSAEEACERHTVCRAGRRCDAHHRFGCDLIEPRLARGTHAGHRRVVHAGPGAPEDG